MQKTDTNVKRGCSWRYLLSKALICSHIADRLWRSFVHLRRIPVGIITTIIHGCFFVTHLLAFFSARSTPSPGEAVEETHAALKGGCLDRVKGLLPRRQSDGVER